MITAKAQLRQSHVAGSLRLSVSSFVGCSFFDKCTQNISVLTGAKTELDTIMSRYTTRSWHLFDRKSRTDFSYKMIEP